jgi:hypothetical protein
MTSSTETQILERLDQMLRLIAIQVAADKSVTERARILKLAGLDNRTIADVLNTTDAAVRTFTSNLRKRPSRKTKP